MSYAEGEGNAVWRITPEILQALKNFHRNCILIKNKPQYKSIYPPSICIRLGLIPPFSDPSPPTSYLKVSTMLSKS